MTDALDRLAPVAMRLLRPVDAALAEAGAAADDRIWPLIRRLRVLPSEAVATMVGWRAATLHVAAPQLREYARRCADAVALVPDHPLWEGEAAAAYAVAWSAARRQVAGAGDDGVAGRLVETARYLEEVADWVDRSRRSLALALGEVLGSAEAVIVMTGVEPPGPAAARIGAHVLEVIAAAYEEGQRLHDEWHPRLAEVPYRSPIIDGPSDFNGALRVLDL